MSPPGNREEPLIRRLARSKALHSSRDASMSPTRAAVRSSSQEPARGPPLGSYYTTQQGTVLQYVPYTFVYPNNTNISNSLPSLHNEQEPSMTRSQVPVMAFASSGGPSPHRRLSKMSNLMWTSSVSQPDLSMTTTSTTMSPSSLMSPTVSQPSSRASSPVPPSVSARGSPGHGPSPYVSPLGSGSSLYYQDLTYLSQALAQLGVAQNYMFPGPVSRPPSRHQMQDLNGNDPGGPGYLVPREGTGSPLPPLMRPRHESYPSSGHPQMAPGPAQDPNVWYCQYVSLPPGAPPEHEPLRAGSCSPSRLVSLAPQQPTGSKPCAVITPHLVSSPRQAADPRIQNHGPPPPVRAASPAANLDNQFGLSSSAPAQNNFWAQESRAPDVPAAHQNDSTLPAHLNAKLRETSPAPGGSPSHDRGSCPDIHFSPTSSLIPPEKISVGTSCSDLLGAVDPAPPFILETCQICNVFHGPDISHEEHKSSPVYTFRPCVYGLQVVAPGGTTVSLKDGGKGQLASWENGIQHDNAPQKYEANSKFQSNLQTGRQYGGTKGSCAMEQLKR